MKPSVLSAEKVAANLKAKARTKPQEYFAMYSSWLDGIVTDPMLMQIPIDDHMVHRGDGIFEAIKVKDGQIYALDRHLQRLWASGQAIGLNLPFSLREISETVIETVRVANKQDALIRLFVSRGPGSFTPNPYDTVGSQLYVVVTALKSLPPERYESGVRVGVSSVAVKEGLFARVKSCNYLANVLMKKESVDRGLDFTIGVCQNGYLAESATENFFFINSQSELVMPNLDRILSGITMLRLAELAEQNLSQLGLKGIRHDNAKLAEVQAAKEVLMCGTTLDVLPVIEVEGVPIGNGRPGPFAAALSRLLLNDLKAGSGILTPIFY